MSLYQVLLLCAALGVAVEATPLASMLGLQRVRRAAQITTVDCSNREAVMFVLRTRANFRCVYPEYNKQTQYKISGNSAQFGSDLESANLIKEESIKCGEGFMYSLDFDMCLEIPNQSTNPMPLETGNLVAENPVMEITSFNGGPSSSDDCPPGTFYNGELSFCMELPNKSVYKPLATGNLHKEEEIGPVVKTAYYEPNGCKGSQIYVASLDICVDKRGMSKRNDRQLESASLVREERSRNRIKCTKTTNMNVQPGENLFICSPEQHCHYSASTGTCNLNSVSGRPTGRPTSKRLVAFRQDNGCGRNEIFSPTIGLCMPFTSGTGRELESASLVKEPVVDSIQSFQENASPDLCRSQGKFFNYEVGLCL